MIASARWPVKSSHANESGEEIISEDWILGSFDPECRPPSRRPFGNGGRWFGGQSLASGEAAVFEREAPAYSPAGPPRMNSACNRA